jgi:cysteinyl-tRNA synthetase
MFDLYKKQIAELRLHEIVETPATKPADLSVKQGKYQIRITFVITEMRHFVQRLQKTEIALVEMHQKIQ